MLHSLLGRFSDYRNLQSTADCFGDVSKGHAFLGNGMISGSCEPVLKHQPVETGSIQPMYRRPALHAIADVGRDTLLAGHGNGKGDQALLLRIDS